MYNQNNEMTEILKTFDWTLSKNVTTTIFAKKKMEEFTDIKKIYGFIKERMGITYQGDNRYKHITFNTELHQIEQFRNMYDRGTKSFQVAFTLSKHKWGRIQPANYLSLSIMHRPTRHGLCEGIYRDIDMVNAQPTAVFEIAKQNGVDMPTLELYVKDPKQYRQMISDHHGCDKDTAKRLPITLMMGGTYKGWMKDNDIQKNRDTMQGIEFINKLEVEMNLVMNLIYAHNKNIEKDVLRQDPGRWPTEQERKRGVMGLWSQTVERIMQEAVIKFLVESKLFKIEHVVPCQDGFMILRDLWYDGILADCDKIVRSLFGINIDFVEKPFDEKIEIPRFDDGKTSFEWHDLISAKPLADRLIRDFGNFIVKYELKIFVFFGNRWYDETDKKQQHHLTRYLSENLYTCLFNEITADISLDDKLRNKLLTDLRYMTSSSGKIADILKQAMAIAPIMTKDFDSNPYLLGFNNGVYDLNLDLFRQYKYDDYMTISVNYDYAKPNYDDAEVQALKDEVLGIIESIHPTEELRNFYYQILASGLDGIGYQHMFLFNGQGGNGKGLVSKLMKQILGDYFHQPPNDLLANEAKANAPSPDIANLKNKRYLDWAEMEGDLQLAIVKKFTGGDTLSGRHLQQAPIKFCLSSTNIIQFNFPPNFIGNTTTNSIVRRLRDVEHATNCVSENDHRIGKTIEGITYIKANTKYETPTFIESVRFVFLDILLEQYAKHRDPVKQGIKFVVPDAVTRRTMKFLENQNIFHMLLNHCWVRDESDTSPRKLKDMWEIITNCEPYKLLKYREKRTYCKEQFCVWMKTQTDILKDNHNVMTVTGYILNDENVASCPE